MEFARIKAGELARNAGQTEVKQLAEIVEELCRRIEALEKWRGTVKIAKFPPPEGETSDA